VADSALCRNAKLILKKSSALKEKNSLSNLDFLEKVNYFNV
jgi:hypothetical protein